ncbi:MAG: hypothetical protein OEZ06_16730 [Myxococcales bacterium]|nr:hypothetical protein [Myxococcales bacterium]
MFSLTAESLAKFAYDQRTNWPGAVQDLGTVAAYPRELGADSFYVHKGKGPGKAGKLYLVFKGNPRKPGLRNGLWQMVRVNGPQSPASVVLGKTRRAIGGPRRGESTKDIQSIFEEIARRAVDAARAVEGRRVLPRTTDTGD